VASAVACSWAHAERQKKLGSNGLLVVFERSADVGDPSNVNCFRMGVDLHDSLIETRSSCSSCPAVILSHVASKFSLGPIEAT
jgi:hypothetical protein